MKKNKTNELTKFTITLEGRHEITGTSGNIDKLLDDFAKAYRKGRLLCIQSRCGESRELKNVVINPKTIMTILTEPATEE